MIEVSLNENIKKAKKKYAEYITNDNLRRLIANKIKEYCGEVPLVVFDCASGSGQLAQYINMSLYRAVEIQAEPLEALKQNFSNTETHNMSFFQYDDQCNNDIAICNYPFSLKLKDLPLDDVMAIQAKYPFKKNGVVDDIFMLKSLENSKRFGFFVASSGVCYRSSEREFRRIIGNNLAELNKCDNCFDDTSISVSLIIIDKQKNSETYKATQYDGKTDKIIGTDTLIIDSDNWRHYSPPIKTEPINIDETEDIIYNSRINSLKSFLKMQHSLVNINFTNKERLKQHILEAIEILNNQLKELDDKES